MPKVTLIARLSDGLPLTASMADENDAYAKEVRSFISTHLFPWATAFRVLWSVLISALL